MFARVLASTLCASLLAGFGSARDARADDVDLWPLYEKEGDSTTFLYPAYVREGEFLMVFPFYYRTNQGLDHHVAWPLFKWSEGRLERAAPFYFSPENETFTLFPLIFQTPRRTFLTVPPLALGEDYTALVPLYMRVNPHHVAAPNFYWTFDADGRLERFHSFGVLRLVRDGEDHDFALLPYGSGRRGDHEWTRLFPLFAYDHRPGRSWIQVANYWSAHEATGRTSRGVFPLFRRTAGPGEERLQVGPFVRVESDDESRLAVYPFFSRGERQVGQERHRHFDFLWPILSRSTRSGPDGTLLERHRRFLLFSDSREPGRGRTFRILGIPVLERVES